MNKRKYPQCYCCDCSKPILNVTRKTIARCKKCYTNLVITTPEANSNWKGGRVIRDGYIEIVCRNHPRRNAHNRVGEHRLVMEKILGRFLEPYEEVHHRDLNPKNNKPNNLILTTRTEHRRQYHHHSPLSCKICGKAGITTKGYCGTHYARWRKQGFPKNGPGPDKKRYPDGCVVCGKSHLARGFCGVHYWQNKIGKL